mmetsp:Transcript_18284/g.21057  ORF Transcript_18284/g.21057 Transcript_18284/m.21057 type:complete len:183 (+) Transcript_18284:138-686(+)
MTSKSQKNNQNQLPFPTSGNLTKTVKFKVTIPPNVLPGQVIRVRLADYTEGDVRVPAGLKAGEDFTFSMPADALTDHKILRDKMIAEQQQKRENALDGNNGSSNKPGSNQNSLLNHGYQDGPSSFLPISTNFVSCNRSDFLAALGIGIIIGLSIVVGFLAGVMVSTAKNDRFTYSPAGLSSA